MEIRRDLYQSKSVCYYLYRTVDKLGNTVDFLLTRKRQRMNVQSFLIKAISNNSLPIVINVDKNGSNTVASKIYNKYSFSNIKIRQCKYLSNIVEQDHRFIKWRIQSGLSFKSFESARRILSAIEVVHTLKKKSDDGVRDNYTDIIL